MFLPQHIIDIISFLTTQVTYNRIALMRTLSVLNSHENWQTWSTLPQVPTEIFNLIMIIVSSGTHITFIILQVNNVSFSSIFKTGSRTYQSYEIMNIA